MHPSRAAQGLTMLRITTEKRRGKITLTVEGKLAGQWTAALEECWRSLRAASPREKFSIDLCGVSFIDSAGKVLLRTIHRDGAQLIAEGCLNQAIVDEISGTGKDARKEVSNEVPTKRPPIIFYGLLLSLLFGSHAQAQNYSPTATSAQAGAVRLTLEQAVNLAVKQNTTAQIAILTAAQSEQDKRIALSQLLPQANLGLQEQRQRNNLEAQFGGNPANVFPVPPGSGSAFPRAVGPFNIFSTGVGFS